MSSFSSIPEIFYIDEQKIENYLSILNKGKINEVVQKSSEAHGSKTSGGLGKIISLQYSSDEREKEETEVLKVMNDVGKFAVLHEFLSIEEELKTIDNGEDIENLQEGDFILITQEVKLSPATKMSSILQDVSGLMGAFPNEIQNQDSKYSQSQLEQLSKALSGDGTKIYESHPSETDRKIVFRIKKDLTKQNLKEETYSILARIDKIYTGKEKDYLIDFLENLPDHMIEGNQGMDKIARGLSKVSDKEIQEEDLKISAPDTLITPLAIYQDKGQSGEPPYNY